MTPGSNDRYGRDVLASDPHTPRRRVVREVEAERDLVVECAVSGFCGAVVCFDKGPTGIAVVLEDRKGLRRPFLLRTAGFLLDGETVTLVRPAVAAQTGPARSASGSITVTGAKARVARDSRIWVEGIHDAELVEKVWGHDLRVDGVVVEPLHGADDLLAAVTAFRPSRDRRIGVLLDHLVPGSKETRIADEVRRLHSPHVVVLGHPYVDVWQAVRPRAVGIGAWPVIPKGQPWKEGVLAALGRPHATQADVADGWRWILGHVRSYADLEPALLARVEELIDVVTA